MWGNGKNGFPQEPQHPPNLFLKGTIDEDFKEMAKKFVKSMFSTNSDVLPIRAQKFVEIMFSTNSDEPSIRAQKFVESMFSTNSVMPSIRAQKFVESMFSTKTYALIEVWFIVEQCFYWVLYFVE